MSPYVIPIVAMLIPMIIVPTALGIKFSTKMRELEHAERMKALELGRTLPQDEPWSSPARISLSIGAGVPVGVFAFAWLATQSSGFRDQIWIAATMTSIASVICGSILAAKHFNHRAEAESLAAGQYAKPQVDADAFDVVGSRG